MIQFIKRLYNKYNLTALHENLEYKKQSIFIKQRTRSLVVSMPFNSSLIHHLYNKYNYVCNFT